MDDVITGQLLATITVAINTFFELLDGELMKEFDVAASRWLINSLLSGFSYCHVAYIGDERWIVEFVINTVNMNIIVCVSVILIIKKIILQISNKATNIMQLRILN